MYYVKTMTHSLKLTTPTIFIMSNISLRHLLSNQISLNIPDLYTDRTRKVLGQCPHLRDEEMGIDLVHMSPWQQQHLLTCLCFLPGMKERKGFLPYL